MRNIFSAPKEQIVLEIDRFRKGVGGDGEKKERKKERRKKERNLKQKHQQIKQT